MAVGQAVLDPVVEALERLRDGAAQLLVQRKIH